MWLEISPIQYIDDYLVKSYISLLHDINNKFPPNLFLKINSKSRIQQVIKEIKKTRMLYQNMHSIKDFEIACNNSMEILSGHNLIAIATIKKSNITCIKSRKNKLAISYDYKWISSKLNNEEISKLDSITSYYKNNFEPQSSP